MKNLLSLVSAATLALTLGVAAHAADAPAAAASAPAATASVPAKARTAQQGKMATCNAEAKDKALKGDERKAFMKECLSSKPAA